VQKRLLLQAAACNLALVLRKMIGARTPRAMQDAVVHLFLVLVQLISAMNIVKPLARSLPLPAFHRIPHQSHYYRCPPQEGPI